MVPHVLAFLTDEFPTAKPPDFLALYRRAAKVLWVFDERLYEMQEHLRLGAARQPRCCCFCGRSETDGALFKSVSHAIPEALGNKRVISLEECDHCNSGYSSYEGELAKMLTVERVFAAARGKRGGRASIGEDSVSSARNERGIEVKFRIDKEKNPPRDVGESELQVTIDEEVECKPALAVRSLLRSAWMALSPLDRSMAPEILAVAAESPETPTEFIVAFSPGAQLAAGFLRVYVRQDAEARDLPAAMASLTFGNTTIIWRAPTPKGYVGAPLPPIQVLDDAKPPRISRLKIDGAAATFSTGKTFQVSYERRIDALSTPTDPVAQLQRHPIEELREQVPVEVSVGTDDDHSPWIDGTRQIKRLSADLTRFSRITLFCGSFGIRVHVSQDEETATFDTTFDPRQVGLSNGMKSLDFLRRLSSAKDGDKLFIRVNGESGAIDLRARPDLVEDARRHTAALEQCQRLAAMADRLHLDLKMPVGVEGDALELLDAFARAVVSGRKIQGARRNALELTISKEEFAARCATAGASFIPLQCVHLAIPALPELRQEVIGPVILHACLDETEKELRAAVIGEDDDNVHLKLNAPFLYVFEKYASAPETA